MANSGDSYESGWYVRPGRVLIVDDDALLLVGIRRLLRDDHEVETVICGEAALARLRRGVRFDVILCDVTMPRMTGIDLLDAIERDYPEQAEAVVFMSGGLCDDLAEQLASRSRGYLQKPFEISVLQDFVRERVRRARAQRVARAPSGT